jgi:ferredoxin
LSTVKVSQGDKVSSIEVENGVSLLEAVSKIKDMNIDASCGGKGTCGKCKVKILKGYLSGPSKNEVKFLSNKNEQDNNLFEFIKFVEPDKKKRENLYKKLLEL